MALSIDFDCSQQSSAPIVVLAGWNESREMVDGSVKDFSMS
jgi:hypothetical protein